MIKKIIAKIKKKLKKTKILDRFFIDGTEYRVVEASSILPSFKNKRSLFFKKDGRIYSHSVIYINPKYHFQPTYQIPQAIIDIWSKTDNALVLGCAGCTLPRFLSLQFPNSHTTGIEISEKFIDIAKKYFLLHEIKDQFHLIHADAIEYIKNNQLKEKYNVIYVDIFDANKLINELFTDDFVTALTNHTDDYSIVIFNLLGKSDAEIIDFAESINSPYDGKYIFSQKEESPVKFLTLVKTANKNSLAEFENCLETIDCTKQKI